ncbi:hypothetical protein Esti_000573 [Eimeria stiedai]
MGTVEDKEALERNRDNDRSHTHVETELAPPQSERQKNERSLTSVVQGRNIGLSGLKLFGAEAFTRSAAAAGLRLQQQRVLLLLQRAGGRVARDADLW